MESPADGISNIVDFWSGGVLHLTESKEHYVKAYEMLALVSALLLSIGVAFYLSDPSSHFYGVVCCIANCALWMSTLSSAFFALIINATSESSGSAEDGNDLQLLVGMRGVRLMRVPMLLFAWGATVLFFEFI